MSYRTLGYNFYTNPIKYTRYFARQYPSYFWSIVIGIVGSSAFKSLLTAAPAGFSVYPYAREYFGLDNSRPDFPPLSYPSILPLVETNSQVPDRRRTPPEGFDDPPPSQLQPTWYLHVPPPSVRKAIESQGLSWPDVLKELERRRDAMVEGDEWDVSFENGNIVWDKPSEEKMRKRLESTEELRQWGTGWRKYVAWTVWKLLGSPEGVFETEDGKVDGKLVLRQLSKGQSDKVEATEKKA